MSHLGSGGQGSVYLGLHRQTSQYWVLKEIALSSGRESYREIKALRGLRHRNLPAIVDLLETDTSLVIVMEYVHGKNLKQLLNETGHLSESMLVDTALQLCDALTYLHERRPPVLHLDIKPANMIRSPSGRLVLVDFGAAFVEDDRAWVIKGTERYAAPELCREEGKPTPECDLYSLGMTLFELAGGRIEEVSLYRLRSRRLPDCSEELCRIIEQCLADRPEDRFHSARELARAIQKAERKTKQSHQRIRFYLALLLTIFSGTLASSIWRHVLWDIPSAKMYSDEGQMSSEEMALEEIPSGQLFSEQRSLEQLSSDPNTSEKESIESMTNQEEKSQNSGSESVASSKYEETAIGNAPYGEAEKVTEANEARFVWVRQVAALRSQLADVQEDGVMDNEEERRIRTVLYTIPDGEELTLEEWLQEEPETYGEICFSVGLTYYFMYEEDGADRLAGEWFTKASTASKDSVTKPEWTILADIYARICQSDTLASQEGIEEAEREKLGLTQNTNEHRLRVAQEQLDTIQTMVNEGLYGSMGSALRLRQWLWLARELSSCSGFLVNEEEREQAIVLIEVLEDGFSVDEAASGSTGTGMLREEFIQYLQIASLLLESAEE